MSQTDSYTMKDLRTVAAYFRGDRRFGRTTKLVNVRTGRVLVEVMGVATKGQAHSAYLNEQCKRNAALLEA